jgi:hypothetical protein
MSQTDLHELSCPNCGAPHESPPNRGSVECAYCGTRFYVPGFKSDTTADNTPQSYTFDTTAPKINITTATWVKWLVIFLVVTTVVPIICSVIAAVCGVVVPLLGVFFTQ